MKPILIFLLTCLATITNAQTNSKGYVAVTVGGSLPLGDLSASPASLPFSTENLPGYAVMGTELGLHGSYYFSTYVGVGTKFCLNAFGIDNNNASKAITRTNSSDGPSSYFAYYTMIGPSFRYYLTDRIELHGMPLIGLGSFSSFKIGEPYNTSGGQYSYTYKNSNSLVLGLNCGFRTTGKIGLIADIQFISFGTQPMTLNYARSSQGGFFQSTTYGKIESQQTISWVSLNAGICVGF